MDVASKSAGMLRLARRGKGKEECVLVCECVGACLVWLLSQLLEQPLEGKAPGDNSCNVCVEGVCQSYPLLNVCRDLFCF